MGALPTELKRKEALDFFWLFDAKAGLAIFHGFVLIMWTSFVLIVWTSLFMFWFSSPHDGDPQLLMALSLFKLSDMNITPQFGVNATLPG